MTAKVILNPYANRWNAQRRQPEAEAALQSAGIDYELELSKEPGHAIELAAQAARQGFHPIIAAGGDSTVNEIVNGVISENPAQALPVGVLPIGTANDLAYNLGIPMDLRQAARLIKEASPRLMDVCQVNDRLFVNNSGVGLEPYITTIQMRIHRVKGIIRYLYATLIGIYQNPRWMMELTWDNGSYHGPVNLVSVGNAPRTGGMFFLTPHADPFDARLTFTFGAVPRRRQMLTILPKAMRAGQGNVAEDPRVFEYHTSRLKIRSETPSPIHTDGEVLSQGVMEFDYRVLPARLTILAPPV
jgi:YegS/Rv2252/BmrU family lipid kinase